MEDYGTIDSLPGLAGYAYSIQDLLGFPPPKPRAKHELHALVFRVPFGEAQRFFAPSNVTLTHALHLPGHLMPKSAGAGHNTAQLWTCDRATLAGSWKGGFFALCAIAT